jgi:type II secretory pathway component PulF
MKKYLVRFTTKSGDYDKEWCYANNEDEAAQQIQDEHWNIERIDMVTEI